MARLQRAESLFSVPKGPEDILLPRRDDGYRVRDEQRRFLFGNATHVADRTPHNNNDNNEQGNDAGKRSTGR